MPKQKYNDEAKEWLRRRLLHRIVRVQIHRRDQYQRLVRPYQSLLRSILMLDMYIYVCVCAGYARSEPCGGRRGCFGGRMCPWRCYKLAGQSSTTRPARNTTVWKWRSGARRPRRGRDMSWRPPLSLNSLHPFPPSPPPNSPGQPGNNGSACGSTGTRTLSIRQTTRSSIFADGNNNLELSRLLPGDIHPVDTCWRQCALYTVIKVQYQESIPCIKHIPARILFPSSPRDSNLLLLQQNTYPQ